MPDYLIRLIETREITLFAEGRDSEAALQLARRVWREAPQLSANVYDVQKAVLRPHPISVKAVEPAVVRPARHYPLEEMICARRS